MEIVKRATLPRFFRTPAIRIKEVYDYFKQGHSALECVEHFGYCERSVYNYLRSYGAKFMHVKENTQNRTYFSHIDNEFKAYYLGLIAADASISKKTNRVIFTIQSKDDYIFKKLKKELECVNKIRRRQVFDKRTRKHNASTSFQFSSPQIKKDLKANGVDENKSHSFIFPVKTPRHLFRHFLRGLLDGDGCIHTSHSGKVDFISTKQFLEVLNQLLFNNKEKIYPKQKTKNVWVMNIQRAATCVDLLNYLYEDGRIYLKRKYRKYQQLKKQTLSLTNASTVVGVKVYDKDGVLKESFNSLGECATHYKIGASHVSHMITDKTIRNGLIFKRGKRTIQYKPYVGKSNFKVSDDWNNIIQSIDSASMSQK